MLRRAFITVLDRMPLLRAAVLRAAGLRRILRLEYLFRVQHATPVIIFQVGKVGSSSVAASFPTTRHPVAIQTHHLHPPLIAAMKKLQRDRGQPIRRHYYDAEIASRYIIGKGRPYKVITLVREPISRAMSNYFQMLGSFVDSSDAGAEPSIEELRNSFMARAAEVNKLFWFEREFEPALGVDVYAHPFPHAQGHLRIPTEQGEILILRLELDDAAKEAAIRDFLDDPSFVLAAANIGESKDYAALYGEFKRRLVLPMDYVDRVHASRYAQHFYSDAERQATRARWEQRALSTPGSP